MMYSYLHCISLSYRNGNWRIHSISW